MVSDVVALNISEAKIKDRIARIAGAQSLDEPQRGRLLLLVPQVDEVELILRFASQQHAFAARLFHLLQTTGTIAAGQKHQHADDARRSRRDGGVVVIEPESEIRVAKRRIERSGQLQRIVDALPVTRRRQILPTMASEQDTRAVRAAQIEPRLRAFGLTSDPRFR